ncbi:hypothetical protein BD410DRAFT_790578 [Rickenella mellea]|uniref:Uncharacterized protein n=1 Tax=Rickenella mellea TaxID=50990 RepID=A0A4Y7Q058_9AGAM|nr:hypothetical protein BD410DRAFT_790578 [Rickenella mellea]
MDTLMAQMKSSTTSNVASPNVTHYLAQFTKVLSGEIRTLLVEVGSLHEKKRSMQFELGELIKMRSRYGLAGDFDPDWAPLPFGMSSLDPPPPPLEVPPSPPKPAWRSVRQRTPSGKKQPSQPPKPPPMRPADPPPEARPVWRLPTVGTRSQPTKKEPPPPPAPKPPALEETTAPPIPAWRNVLRRYRKTEKVRSDSIVSRSGSQETLPEETAWATWKADDTIKFTPPAGKHIKLGPPPPPPPVGLFGSTTTHSSQYPRLRQD